MTAPDLPPPPPFSPPPGYASYAPTNWAASMRRIGGLAKALLIVLAIVALGQVVSVATTGSVGDAAADYLRSDRSNAAQDAFEDDLAVNGLTSLVAGAASIAVIVLSIVWLYRVAANHRGLGRRLTWAPGWAIAGWVLPPLLFMIPLLMLRESWKAVVRRRATRVAGVEEQGRFPADLGVVLAVQHRADRARRAGCLADLERQPEHRRSRRVLRRAAGPDHRPGHRHGARGDRLGVSWSATSPAGTAS